MDLLITFVKKRHVLTNFTTSNGIKPPQRVAIIVDIQREASVGPLNDPLDGLGSDLD